MELIKEKATAACSWNRSGPGKMPWINSPPSRTAAVGLPGTESVSSGTSDGPTMALLALSAATTPSLSPVPYFARFLEKRRDWS